MLTGFLPIPSRVSYTSSKDGEFAFADRTAAIRDGIPADRRVVDACVMMQAMAPCEVSILVHHESVIKDHT